MRKLTTLLIIFVLASACKKEDTVWETGWSAPIINDTLSFDNLTNDSTMVNSGGYYALDLSRTLFDLKVSDFVSIPDTTIEQVTNLTAGLSISPGFSFVNEVDEHFIDLEEIQLKTVMLKGGYIDVFVENPLGTTTIFGVDLPGVTKDGIPFSASYSAPPGSQANPGIAQASIDLSGYTLDLTGISGGEYNLLKSQITASTDANGPSVFISAGDQTVVKATFRDIEINYARGYFGNRTVTDTTNIFLDIMNKVHAGMIDLPNTSITFEIENGIKVSAEGELTTVSNINNSGTTVNLTGGQVGTSFNIDPASGTWNSLVPSLKAINFNSTNSNIEQYIENLGASHNMGYSLQMNPWGNVSGSWDELFPDSKLRINMQAQMPMNIGVDGLVLRDTFDIQLNQDPGKTNIKSGELILQASNGFPISGGVKLMLRNAAGTVLHTISGSSEMRSSLYGTFNAQHGFNVEDSDIRFVLSEDVIDDINEVYSIVVESTFNSVNPSTGLNEQQNIPFGAFLAIKLKTKFITENRF